MAEQNKQIQKVPIEANGRGLQLKSIDDYWRWANWVIESKLAPAHYTKPQQVVLVTQAGVELGFTIFQSLQVFHVVSGKVGIASTAMGGLIRSRANIEFMKEYYDGEPFDDGFRAIVESKRKNENAIHVSDYSVADAKQAKLWDKAGSWQTDPKDMLMWRALSKHARRYYGDVLCGLYTAEELQDMRPEQGYTPETPKRADRKRIESKQKDTEQQQGDVKQPEGDRNQLIASCVEAVFSMWLDKNLDMRLADHNEIIEGWALFCAEALNDDSEKFWQFDDEMKKTFALDNLDEKKLVSLKKAAEELPEPKSELPGPAQTQSKQQDDYKYICKRCKKQYKRKPKDGNCSCLGELTENK